MRKFVSMMLFLSLFLVSCEKTLDGGKTSLTLLSESVVEFPSDGGRGVIDFSLKNPVEGTEIEVVSSDYWVCGLIPGDNKIDFSVLKNGVREQRRATITVSYGEEHSFVVEVVQGEAGFDVEFKAEVLNGTYFGQVGSEGFNYSIILSDIGVPDNGNLYYNSISYHFELFSDVSHGFNPGPHDAPTGTYTFDGMNEGRPGTFIGKPEYTYLAVAGSSNIDMYSIIDGTVVITETGIQANVRTDDGKWHQVTYEGDLLLSYEYLANVVRPYSKLASDYSFDNDGFLHAYYRGDYFGFGCDVWFIDMCETILPMNGDYLMAMIMVDKSKGGYREDAFLGEYVVAVEGADNYVGTFAPGSLQQGFSPYCTWLMKIENSMMLSDQGGPIADGKLTFAKDGDRYLVTIDCVDDAGNKVQGTFNCALDYYLNQDAVNPDADLLPAL